MSQKEKETIEGKDKRSKYSFKDYVLIALLLCIIAGVLILYYSRDNNSTSVPAPAETDAPVMLETPEPDVVVVTNEIEVEKTFTAAMIEEELKDMGVLITSEYLFTCVISNTQARKWFNTDINIGITESSFLASYDGTVGAGIDFTKVVVEKDEETKTVTITMPDAAIQYIDVDPDSFQIYEEKTGIGTRISVEDYNTSLNTLEADAETKAVENGLLEQANKNAEALIKSFVSGLIDPSYIIKCATSAE